jgi:hypothetical protein
MQCHPSRTNRPQKYCYKLGLDRSCVASFVTIKKFQIILADHQRSETLAEKNPKTIQWDY